MGHLYLHISYSSLIWSNWASKSKLLHANHTLVSYWVGQLVLSLSVANLWPWVQPSQHWLVKFILPVQIFSLPQSSMWCSATNLDALNAKLLKCFVCWYLSRLHHHPLRTQHQGVNGEPLGCHPEWMTVWYHWPRSINHFPASFDEDTVGLVASSVGVLHH